MHHAIVWKVFFLIVFKGIKQNQTIHCVVIIFGRIYIVGTSRSEKETRFRMETYLHSYNVKRKCGFV